MSKVRVVKSLDNSIHNSDSRNSEPGWSRIVAGVAVSAASIITLAITGSMEQATTVALLVMLPFKAPYGPSGMPAVRLHPVRIIRRAYAHGALRPRHNCDASSRSCAFEKVREAE